MPARLADGFVSDARKSYILIAYTRFETLQTFSEIGELWRCNEDDVQLLNHTTSELEVLWEGL